MTVWRQAGFWLGALVAFILFLLVFSEILLPFVAGMVLAYALDPVADRLEALGLGRLGATLTILVLLIVLVALAVILFVPVLANQLADFIQRIPEYVDRLQSLFSTLIHSQLSAYLGIDPTEIGTSLRGLTSQGSSWIAAILASLWSGGQAFLNIIALFIVTPVVAFYVLYDWDRLVARVDSWLPRDHVEEIRQIAREIDRAIAAFIRGQGLTCLILATWYSTALVMIGLNFGFLIGLAAGLLSFIPFVGATGGFIVAVAVSIVQFWPDWPWIVATMGVFIAGQFIENYILQPRLIGQNVGLHPVWVMFALFAFGYLFGFVGVMIAIPAAAAVGVLVRYALNRYLQSPIYQGSDTGPSVS
jgi:predicted PurR-regulated permease PerM